ncbi:hypothetical protein [Parvularcula lutaonensis]|uniref:Uncharacterized protein n=1 Tax=Parvularcula lutaonensis TaxID=491923 RepID=A0ABV7MBP5_9PROT|nr:hypothetical protein [Parvularcula lutaonensis]GGY39247.1 hypothetical protein GCM10007148_04450 [Parvularcula lutaonensis]
MNRTRIILLIFAALALLILGTTIYNVSNFQFAECENEVVQTALAPSGEVKAVLFERQCGSEIRTSAHISILAADLDLPNEFGNAIAIQDEPGQVIAGMRWLSDSELEVAITTEELVNQRKEYPQDVEVTLVRVGQ